LSILEFIQARKKKRGKKKDKKKKSKHKKKYEINIHSLIYLYRDAGDSNGGPWDFGSGSYNTKEAKAKLKGEAYDDKYDHKCNMTKSAKPKNIEDDFDDFGLDSDEDE
jgi:hypothetical protein